jgi:hypothetical protein
VGRAQVTATATQWRLEIIAIGGNEDPGIVPEGEPSLF